MGDGNSGMIIVARDVEDRVRLETELRRQAGTDALTGLLNRQAFLTALETHLAVGPMAVLFCDLDGFKSVNDTEGHASGDALLLQAAERIALAVRPGQLVARLGGDEFAVLVPPGAVPAPTALIAVERAAEQLAESLVEQLARTRWDGRIGVSIGVVLAAGPGGAGPGGADRAQEILRDADLAMYECKARGGGAWVWFEPAMRERVLTRSQLRADLERAIAEDGLSIDLQPIVDVATGVWSQFEALVRWRDGDRTRQPGEFLPLAEETGLMVPLGTWVLRAALAWLAVWPDAEAGVSVNVTGGQVAEPGFVDMVRGELDRHGLAPGRLTLEITEQTAVQDLGRAGAVLQPLRALGVHVALDDFGTGFCSLGYLAQLPVDELKIDRQFVSGLGVRSADDALVRAVLGLAEDLGLRVVAEGVETAEQADILRGYGCPLVQGYLYSRPTPAGVIVPGGAFRPAPAPGSGRIPRQDDASRREASPPERV
jgi:diguanylate cyclase (GGDEF)-like protein